VDLHHNVFYSYRGQIAQADDRERQLENNLTKALVNTLSLGGEDVCRAFLAEIDIPDARGSKFLLQRRDLPVSSAKDRRDRVLLGITKCESRCAFPPGVDKTYDSVPDAWIYGDGFAVLVENKVNGDFSPEQMQAHLDYLRHDGYPPPRVVLTTWRQLHCIFGRLLLLPELTGVAKFLIEQFIQFLEYSAMSGFTGFRTEHFRYFLLHDDDDARRWIREQVDSFAGLVLASLKAAEPFYDSFDVGNLPAASSSCWVAFGPRDYRKVTHQTISLASDGLRIFVNTELKPATDRLRRVVLRSESEVRSALQNLHAFEPFELVLQERTQRQAMLYDYTPKMRLHSSMLAEAAGDTAWSALVQTVNRLPLPNLTIERLLPPKELVGSEPVQQVVDILLRNHAIVRMLNE
jgi:hypothetical protein